MSAIFRFVTPIKNKPSPQQLIIGLWIPEVAEVSEGIWYGLGAALKLYWGQDYCGVRSREGEAAKNFYLKALEMFNFSPQLLGDDENTCEFMERSSYPKKGFMSFPQYFDLVLPSAFLDAGNLAAATFYPVAEISSPRLAFESTCIPVMYPTPYSLWTLGDYKRCVEAVNIWCSSNSCP